MSLIAGLVFALMAVCAQAASGWQMEKRQSQDEMAAMMQGMMSGADEESIELVCNLLCTNQGEDNSEITERLDAISSRLQVIEDAITGLATAGGDTAPRPEWAKKYPVYMVESPYGHYELTKSEAARMCEESGGVQASIRQLEAAFNHGMDWCACGWVEEGFAAYPIQFPRDGCSKNTAPGIRTCTWQSTWNAWCMQTGFA